MTADGLRAPPKRSRRDEIIALAAGILREGGPTALTSVSVAESAGISQSSVYRHVASMEELAALASERVLTDLAGALAAAVTSADIDGETADDISVLASRMMGVMKESSTAYDVVDRWQFVDGPLGEAVRTLVDEACTTIAMLLEHRWRRESGWDGPLDDDVVRLQLAHARSFQADGHTVARVVRTTDDPATLAALTTVLTSRIIGGWHAYVADMQRQTGIGQRTGAAGISSA